MSVFSDLDCSSQHWQPTQVKIIDGKPVRISDVVVCQIRISDVEDPDLAVAEPMWNWQQSEAGQWVFANAVEKPYWVRQIDTNTYGHLYLIVARLKESDQTFWRLKWGGHNK